MAAQKKIDDVTGVETTGHVWDGDLEELNKPLPRWWLYVLYASIVWSIGYWIAYPAWPTLTGYTAGYLGYSQRATVAADIKESKMEQGKYLTAISSATPAEILQQPEMLEFARSGGAAVFANHCSGCHGRGAQGFAGYPNLNDDDWLWGGSLESIQKTISFGIRSGDKNAHNSAMPRFGQDQLLTPEQVSDLAHYVRTLSKAGGTDAEAAGRGQPIFADQCAACHGADGKGNQGFGAPNLTDPIWLYGSDQQAVMQSIITGRGGIMPAWSGRFDPETIKMLTVYVHTLGGGKK